MIGLYQRFALTLCCFFDGWTLKAYLRRGILVNETKEGIQIIGTLRIQIPQVEWAGN